MFERICDKANKNKRFVFFTGAGISTDSGIKDFRSVNGLYSEGLYGGYSPEEILSIEFLEKKPEKFFKFYRNKILNGDISPNDVQSIEILKDAASVFIQESLWLMVIRL